MIDLSLYKTRADVDHIDIAIETRHQSQCRHVSEKLSAPLGRHPRVTDAAKRSHATGSSFIARVQRPTPTMLREALRVLDGRWGLAATPEVVELEVAVAFRSSRGLLAVPGQAELERARLVSLLQHH